ncbi:MAG TPA: 3-methyl-2-oxobutanoate hydroxymethyltransferase [Tepidisphaeraceae bacterium]|jgi:3-methyl-2-oxobutanoate hydroxymethyltransferase|nr:3-methyl-2-oxobutanoate hydroxymethyltransferase [Tepidisphaeraceae bacterium]
MPTPLAKKFTIADLRASRKSKRKTAMLTCYDFTTARLMQQAGVPALLVGDSAANVILGYETTLPVSLPFMIEITRAVRKGAPLCLVMADMPFGSYHGSLDRGVRNVCRMVKQTGCDAVKIEAAASQLPLIRELADAGVAVIAHLGLKPQSVGVLGSYRFQGRTAYDASAIVSFAIDAADAGAAGILLEAVPPEVSAAVVDAVDVPIIGCGAGPACDAHVFVTHDALGLSNRTPRFVPHLGDLATPMVAHFADYVNIVERGEYPAVEHCYEMPADERAIFLRGIPF